jgi:hypothetical protein
MKIKPNPLAKRKNTVQLTFHISRQPYSISFNARFISALGFSILILLADGCKKKSVAPPPPEVQVITLAPTNIPIFEEWIGTLDGFVNAQIRAQVSGCPPRDIQQWGRIEIAWPTGRKSMRWRGRLPS